MIRVSSLSLPLGHDDEAIARALAKRLGVRRDELRAHSVFKRSFDARGRAVRAVYTVDAEVTDESAVLHRFAEDSQVRSAPDMTYRGVGVTKTPRGPRPVVIGTGPCGLLAGVILAECGLQPLIVERGKSVRERTSDASALWRKGELNPESNVQFGEGGAGTFSDGKLYSQVRDPRHLGRKVISELVEAGAPAEILYEGRPHIGTFKLVQVVESIRRKIVSLGGEIRFESRVDDLEIEDGALRGVRLSTGEEIRTDQAILAVGHSARDTFHMLHRRGVTIEPKAFSIGFRVEHPQHMVDAARYGKHAGHSQLGAADYRLSHACQAPGLEGRTVYSFCMCPGGTVVAASSEAGGVVTNGMSQYDRAERNANAGIVVDISPAIDFPDGPLAGVELQRDLERRAFEAAGGTYEAPGQLVGDLLSARASIDLGSVQPSYRPGVRLGDLRDTAPEFVIDAIREALPVFDRRLRGFAREDAIFTGVETRTSSPIRIPRDDSCESTNTNGLFPAGEGAGYAGGILSAGIDGIRVAEAVARRLL